MVGTLNVQEKYKENKCRLPLLLFLILTLSGCSFLSSEAEGEEDTYVNWRLMGMMFNLHVIEKYIEYDNGDYVRLLKGESVDNAYDKERQEENYIVLTEVGALVEEGEDVVVNFDDSEWQIDGEDEYKFIDMRGPLSESARLREVDWCEEEDTGWPDGEIPASSFYLNWSEDFKESYSTEEEYLESMEDYVNCGSGHI